MRKLRIGVVEILGNRPVDNNYKRIMAVNLSSVMPQSIAVWCEKKGHDVSLAQYFGPNPIGDPLPTNLDVVFIAAFTNFAQVAYALSYFYRSQGAITAIGGPHARAYPEDASKYFDYVLGFTDEETIDNVLQGLQLHRPQGVQISALQQPKRLPSVQERWKFITQILQHSPWMKIVPTLGSFGCPYRCSFCVDSIVPYQPIQPMLNRVDKCF